MSTRSIERFSAMSVFDGKRLFDLAVAGSALVLLSPVLLIVSAAVLIALGRPVIFGQLRPGLGGKPFRLLKFRTMTNARDDSGRPLADESRLTGFGRFLRSTSLDELPELWNVVRGDMSLVGPRPLLVQYLERYSPEQARRHEVRPGLTGWAQVNGRNSLGWPERLTMDVWYVDHRTFWLDLKILVLTVKAVFSRDGINSEGSATMHEFMGNEASGQGQADE